jgi:hypothetical protein
VDSGVPFTFLHETVLCGARELLAFRAHSLWLTCLPFALFQEAVERGASQGLAILVNRFGCARFLRHCRAERQGRLIPARKIRFMDFLLLVNLPFIAKIADPSGTSEPINPHTL